MNEFAVGGDDVAGSEGEVGDCAEGESNDSSTVESEQGFIGSKEFDPLLLELLTGTASRDWDRPPFGFSSLPGIGERRLLEGMTAEADELLPKDGLLFGETEEV